MQIVKKQLFSLSDLIPLDFYLFKSYNKNKVIKYKKNKVYSKDI